MQPERIQSFEEFWPYYLNEHAKGVTRWFHFVGTNIGIMILVYSISTSNWKAIPLAVIFGYAFAWVSHFFIEKNRPATFTYPGWSFKADFRLCRLMWIGRLGPELKKHLKEQPLI